MKLRYAFPLLVSVVFALSAFSQNISSADSVVLNKILEGNRQYQTIRTQFQHDRYKGDKLRHRFGTLYYEALHPKNKKDVSALISMLYSDPKGEYYIITDKKLHNVISGFHLHFNYKIIPLMKQLGNAMAWAMKGDIYSLYDNFNVDLKITADNNFYTVSLDSRRGFNKGINRLVLKYDKKNYLISYMLMEEKLGVTHIYTIGKDAAGHIHQPVFNQPIDAAVFSVEGRMR